MYILIIIAVLLYILGYIVKYINSNKNITINENCYLPKMNPMTETEKTFLSYLKHFTDKYNLIILPQVQLQSIFKLSNNKDITSFNKIKSKSVDFAIVDNKYNYKLFIELDDYTHNPKNRIERDSFVNNLFNTYNLKLRRIKAQKNYDLELIENIIKEVVN